MYVTTDRVLSNDCGVYKNGGGIVFHLQISRGRTTFVAIVGVGVERIISCLDIKQGTGWSWKSATRRRIDRCVRRTKQNFKRVMKSQGHRRQASQAGEMWGLSVKLEGIIIESAVEGVICGKKETTRREASTKWAAMPPRPRAPLLDTKLERDKKTTGS